MNILYLKVEFDIFPNTATKIITSSCSFSSVNVFRMEFIAEECALPAKGLSNIPSFPLRHNVPTAFDLSLSIQQPQHRFSEGCLQLTLPLFYTVYMDGVPTINNQAGGTNSYR